MPKCRTLTALLSASLLGTAALAVSLHCSALAAAEAPEFIKLTEQKLREQHQRALTLRRAYLADVRMLSNWVYLYGKVGHEPSGMLPEHMQQRYRSNADEIKAIREHCLENLFLHPERIFRRFEEQQDHFNSLKQPDYMPRQFQNNQLAAAFLNLSLGLTGTVFYITPQLLPWYGTVLERVFFRGASGLLLGAMGAGLAGQFYTLANNHQRYSEEAVQFRNDADKLIDKQLSALNRAERALNNLTEDEPFARFQANLLRARNLIHENIALSLLGEVITDKETLEKLSERIAAAQQGQLTNIKTQYSYFDSDSTIDLLKESPVTYMKFSILNADEQEEEFPCSGIWVIHDQEQGHYYLKQHPRGDDEFIVVRLFSPEVVMYYTKQISHLLEYSTIELSQL